MESMRNYTLYIQKVKGAELWYASYIDDEGKELWRKQYAHDPQPFECYKEMQAEGVL